MFIDAHCHLHFSQYTNVLSKIMNHMKIQNVSHALCASVNLKNFPDILNITKKYENIYSSVGIHPDCEEIYLLEIEKLINLAKTPKVVAIGETGLDYHFTAHDDRAIEFQQKSFRMHIQIARLLKKPLIIHTRNATADTIKLMKEEHADAVGGMMHCFTESLDIAKQAINLNFYISFSGIITFKNAQSLRETCKKIPMDRLLIETDSPFLAPVPYRGRVNEPSWIVHTAECIASLKNLPIEEIALYTKNNFLKLFSINEKIKHI